MHKKLDFAIIGGDMRQVHLAEQLASDGHCVRAYALEKHDFTPAVTKAYNLQELTHPADCVILPLPLSGEAGYLNAPMAFTPHLTEEIFSLFQPGQTVIGGKIDHSFFELAGRCGIRLFDYLEREEFSVANAIPSAEGAISKAMQELDVTIHGLKVLVCGFGRIGKLIANILKSMGAHVTVSARKFSDITWADAYGYETLNTNSLHSKVSEFDLIFNTVPHLIFTGEILSELKSNCMCIDLASMPGGVDFQAAKELGIRAFHELSLPGRVAPVTAGKAMKKTIYNIIEEWS